LEYAKNEDYGLVYLKKTYNQVPQETFREFCGSALLTLACYWPSSHCRPIPAQNFVTFRIDKSKPFDLDIWHLLICVLSLLFIIYSIRTR